MTFKNNTPYSDASVIEVPAVRIGDVLREQVSGMLRHRFLGPARHAFRGADLGRPPVLALVVSAHPVLVGEA